MSQPCPELFDQVNQTYFAKNDWEGEKRKKKLSLEMPRLFFISPHILTFQAQKQVFNLMKYDCYPRFLRSPIYRECVQALQHNEQPPISELTLNDPDLNVDFDCGDGDNGSLNRNSALKKSESDAGERRRRSLLPWPKKDRSKSKVCSKPLSR